MALTQGALSLISQYQEQNHFGKFLEMSFKILNEGEVEYCLTINKNHLATPNAGHGGVIAALMDGLLGVTALSVVANDLKVVATVEFKINFFNPFFEGDELCGKGMIEQKGKRILIVSGEIVATNRNNMKIAKATGTFNSYPAEKAGYKI